MTFFFCAYTTQCYIDTVAPPMGCWITLFCDSYATQPDLNLDSQHPWPDTACQPTWVLTSNILIIFGPNRHSYASFESSWPGELWEDVFPARVTLKWWAPLWGGTTHTASFSAIPGHPWGGGVQLRVALPPPGLAGCQPQKQRSSGPLLPLCLIPLLKKEDQNTPGGKTCILSQSE